MGVKGIVKYIVKRLLVLTVFALILLFLPNLPPYVGTFEEPWSVVPTKPFEGKLALNEKLKNVQIWHKDELIGPEAFADYQGELYTTLYGGDVVKLTGNHHITPVVKTGNPCKGAWEESMCGRPLGLQFDKNGVLYVADAYFGLLKVNIKTGTKEHLFDLDRVGGQRPKIVNNFAIDSAGDIYWSDSSTDFELHDGIFSMLADPSGRLVYFNPITRTQKVLLKNLHFANGVALSDDEEFVIVAETGQSRIRRYYLKGPKKGQNDTFIDGLPGIPDNIKPDGRGGFLVPLVMAKDEDHPSLFQIIGPHLWIRTLAARAMALPQAIFAQINKIYPNEISQKIVHFIGNFNSITGIFNPARTTILRISKTGQIIDSLHTFNKNVGLFAEAHIFNDMLYLGSSFNNYIGRISLAEIGWEELSPSRQKREAPKVEPVVQQATTATPQKPTTTTPKPAKQEPTKQPVKKEAPPPVKVEEPVKKQTPPPVKAEEPVKTQTPPPVKVQEPVKKETAPPVKVEEPVRKQTPPSVKKETVPPVKVEEPVKKQVPPPVKVQEPVKKETAPPGKVEEPVKQSPPPVKVAEPVKKQAPPPAKVEEPVKQSPPPVKVAEPVKKQTPHPAKVEEPVKKTVPPPAKVEEPVKKQTPPQVKVQETVKQQAPSPVQAEEPVKKETAPPVKVKEPIKQQAASPTEAPKQTTKTDAAKEQRKAVPEKEL